MKGIKVYGWVHRKDNDINENELYAFVDAFTEFIESRGLLFVGVHNSCTEEEFCEEDE